MNFLQKSTVALIGKFAGAILSLLISVFLARFLGVAGVGQYQLIISTQVVIITILAMGFGNASIYFINSGKVSRKDIVNNLLLFFLLISVLLALLFGFVLFLLPDYFGYLRLYSILIFVTGSAALLLYNVLMPVLYADLEIVKLQILSLISSIIIIIGIVVFDKIDIFNVNIVLALTGIGSISTTFILLFYLRNDLDTKVKLDFSLLGELFLYGIKISAANLVFILSSNVVIFIMKHYLDDGFEAVGLFSRASAIANMFLILPTTIGPLLYSKWSSLLKVNVHFEVEKALRILVSLSLFCTLFIIIFGKQILLVLYGKEFIGANPALIILSSSIVFSSMTIVMVNYFSSIGRPLVTLKIFIVSLIITFILSIILIPLHGIMGAATSVLFGLVCNVIGLIYYIRKEIPISVTNCIFIKMVDFKNIYSSLIEGK